MSNDHATYLSIYLQLGIDMMILKIRYDMCNILCCKKLSVFGYYRRKLFFIKRVWLDEK